MPPIPKHVFEDRSGKRFRFLVLLAFLFSLFTIGFSAEFVFRVFNLKPSSQTPQVFDTLSDSDSWLTPGFDMTSVVMKESAFTDCRQGLLNFSRSTSGIAAYIPYGDPTALSGLRARCADLEAVYYQAFSFGAPDGNIIPLGTGGAVFPLPEFNIGFFSRNRPAAFPVLEPRTGTSAETLETVFSGDDSSSVFLNQLRSLDLTGVDGGICIDLQDYPDISAPVLNTLFSAINNWLEPLGLSSCLIGKMDANFWKNSTLVDLVDRPLLLGFKDTSNPAVPIAAQDWFDGALTSATARIPANKLSLAIGSFSTLWKSGLRTPERIPYVEAMLRTSYFEGKLNYLADTGSTNARYLDENRRLNQVWVQDALSFYNQRRTLEPETQVVIWPLGYEDSTIWELTAPDVTPEEARAAIESEIDLSNEVVVEGAGPFSTHIADASPGLRQVSRTPGQTRIDGQIYEQIPSPRRLRLFGQSADLALAVTFNGLGSARETDRLLALLAEFEISATFFLSTGDILLSEDIVEKLIAAEHTIGTNTVPQESRLALSRFVTTVRNNMVQQLLQDRLGHHAILVQSPAGYGQFPGDQAVLDQMQDLRASGYLLVYSKFAAPYGNFDPQEFTAQIRKSAFEAPANVISFDFSEQNDRTINALLPSIFSRLTEDGFTFTALPEAAGLSADDVFPVATEQPAARDKIIYWLMSITWIGVQNFIFLLALTIALHTPVYLFLAFIRRERYPYNEDFKPPVTVIIPAYNEAKVIGKTLKSVLASDYPNLKVVVVDDGSKDQTAEVIEEFVQKNKRVTLIRQSNHGKWFAEDRALSYIDTPIFVIVDADTLLRRDAIKLLVQPFCDDAVGAVAGTVEIGNRDNVITACQVIEYKFTQSVMRRAYEVINGILVVPGAIGAWRKDAVIQSGLVSGDTITEDADLTVALHRSGYKVVYTPAAKSYTEAPNSVRAFLQQRLRWSLGMLQVAWKHKRSIIEGQPVGFISILDAVWFRLISSFVYPLVDVIVVSTLAFWLYEILTRGTMSFNDLSLSVVVMFLMFTLLDVINLAAAFWFEKKFEWKLLLLVPFLRFGYRQLLYISSMRSIAHAITGRLRGWQKLKRTDTAQIFDEPG